MQSLTHTRPTSGLGTWIFRLVSIAIIIAGTLGYLNLRDTSAELDSKNTALASAPVIAGKVSVGDEQVVIPSEDLFAAGEMWSLTSRKHPLEKSFAISDLTSSPITTGGGEKLQVSKKIAGPLAALAAAARADGLELVVSSAYRSITDQEALFDSYVSKYGEAMAREYVSPPGSSEHHTGLAIDISDASAPCEQDSDKCSLSMASAAWLVENGPKYGFVLRYPEGKQPITGVSYEWWHYRYVGVPLARALSTSDLTLDEALEKMRTVSARE